MSVLQSFSVHKTARIGTNSPFRLESSSSDGTDAKRNENGTIRKRYKKFRCTIVGRCKNLNFFLAATVHVQCTCVHVHAFYNVCMYMEFFSVEALMCLKYYIILYD